MSTTRREFIRTTSAAGLVVALPAVAAARPLSSHTRQHRSPNEEIRVAVIGLRGRGWNHVQAFEALEHVTVVALCDCDRAVLEKRAGEFEQAHGRSIDAVIDYRTLLDRPDIDVISIATPNHWHALMTMNACLAGKDVYVEKPVSHSIGEGERMLKIADSTGRIVQTGTQSRSAPAIKDGIAWMHEGHLGPITLARGLCYKPRRSIGRVHRAQHVPESVDYELWIGPSPMESLLRKNLHYDWHWDFDTGNGDIGNQGVHQIDVCRWALGAQSMPRSVTSIGGRLGYHDDGNTPNTQVVLLDYDTAPLLFEVRGLPRNRAAQSDNWEGSMDTYMDQRIASIIHCEGGALVVPTGSRNCWAVDLEGTRLQSWSAGGNHFADFIAAVRSRQREDLSADITEGVRSSDLCHLGNISHQVGEKGNAQAALSAAGDHAPFRDALTRMHAHLTANSIDVTADVLVIGPTLDINPDDGQFVQSDIANALRFRSGRAPFTYPQIS